jgi:hypothetical protein
LRFVALINGPGDDVGDDDATGIAGDSPNIIDRSRFATERFFDDETVVARADGLTGVTFAAAFFPVVVALTFLPLSRTGDFKKRKKKCPLGN